MDPFTFEMDVEFGGGSSKLCVCTSWMLNGDGENGKKRKEKRQRIDGNIFNSIKLDKKRRWDETKRDETKRKEKRKEKLQLNYPTNFIISLTKIHSK